MSEISPVVSIEDTINTFESDTEVTIQPLKLKQPESYQIQNQSVWTPTKQIKTISYNHNHNSSSGIYPPSPPSSNSNSTGTAHSTLTSNLDFELLDNSNPSWSNHKSYNNSNNNRSRISGRPITMNMMPPVSSLDSSWRSDSPTKKFGSSSNLLNKEREVIWDISATNSSSNSTMNNLNDNLDALGLSATTSTNSDHVPLPLPLPFPSSASSSSLFNSNNNSNSKSLIRKDEKLKNKQKELYDNGNDHHQQQPMSIDVLAKVMDTSKGRDKVLKCLQYSLRTYLYLLTLITRIRPLSKWFKSNSKRVKIAVSGLSLTRKCLLLLNPLHPLSDLLSNEPMSAKTLVGHLIDLFSCISDDIYCLAKLGLVNKRTGDWGDKWSNRLWLLTTLMGLYKLHFKTIPKIANSACSVEKRRNELSDAKWTNRKYIADLFFVSYDVFEPDYPNFGEPMKCFTGLLAGLISAFKLYDAQWEASIGKG
ncbi:uncharacterized protein L201_004618 [Kwoniella dendrophila CBS 6074]|uniref:Peroxisomal membrane protein PEX16 n=1 Tax=Kwoniella dendrophila CBS 6074 TaxID=1295534 RepID=A0AAX4JXS2_9TREE